MYAFWAFSTLLLAVALGAPNGSPPAADSNAPDITLKTRTTSEFQTPSAAQSHVRTEALYITNGRERRDSVWEAVAGSSSMNTSSIRDCRQHRWVVLAHGPQTYNIQPFPDLAAQRATAERIARAKAEMKAGRIRPLPAPLNAPVTTLETIDTGERRELSGLTLRHLRQTEATSGGTWPQESAVEPGTRTQVTIGPSQQRKVTRDGWYVDLPELSDCGESAITGPQAAGFAMLRAGIDVAPRLEFKGVSPLLGTPVEETRTTEYGNGMITIEKTELIELSRAPVDPRLFDVPRGYREALHTPNGGRDMMQPDTLFNRARAWWLQVWPGWTYWSARVDH